MKKSTTVLTDPALAYSRYTRQALLAIAGISLLGMLVYQITLWNGANDSKLINKSGRQRMLSQQLVKDALLILELPEHPGYNPQIGQIAINLETLKISQRELVTRDNISFLEGRNPAIIQSSLQEVQPYFEALYQALSSLLVKPGDESDWMEIKKHLKATILENEIYFLTGMDYITGLYTQEGQRRNGFFRILHISIFAINFLVLLLIYAFIFRPFATRLSGYFHELNRTMLILQDQASIDQLTGLFNKRSGLMFLEKEYKHCLREGSDMSVLFMDLDRLKFVNDTYGHEAGDRLILKFALGIKNAIRANDHAFRYGGDEFVLILSGSVNSSAKVLNRLTSLANCGGKDCDDEPENINFSWGVATLAENRHLNALELLQLADERMYANKRAKKAKAT